MTGGAWEPRETAPGKNHKFATAIGEAIAKNDASPLVAALREHFGSRTRHLDDGAAIHLECVRQN